MSNQYMFDSEIFVLLELPIEELARNLGQANAIRGRLEDYSPVLERYIIVSYTKFKKGEHLSQLTIRDKSKPRAKENGYIFECFVHPKIFVGQ